MRFYAVMKSTFGKNDAERVAMCVSREDAIRVMNHLSIVNENEEDPLFDPNHNTVYQIKSIPVNVEKLIALGIISLGE